MKKASLKIIAVFFVIVLLAGLFFAWKKDKEHKQALARITEYCQNPKVEPALDGYKKPDDMFSHLQTELRTEIRTKKFENITVYANREPEYESDFRGGIENNLEEICTASKSKLPPRTFLFGYQLNGAYSVMGVARNKIPTGLRDSVLENTVSYVVVKNDTQAVVHSFEFSTYMNQFGGKKEHYRRITKKDIKEIVYLILKDNAPEVL